MKKSYILGAVIVLLLVIAGAFFSGNFQDLQGRLRGGSISLSTSSPSGAKTVSSSDTFFIVNVTASSTRGAVIQVGDILELTLTSDADFDQTAAEALEVDSRSGSGDYGRGYIVVVDDSLAKVGVVVTDEIQISAGTTESISFTLSTADLLDDDSGIDDPLNVSMRYETTTVRGNTLNY